MLGWKTRETIDPELQELYEFGDSIKRVCLAITGVIIMVSVIAIKLIIIATRIAMKE